MVCVSRVAASPELRALVLASGELSWADVAGIALQHVVPVLGHGIHVERREPDLVRLWRALCSEKVLTLVQPWQGVVRPVEHREGHLLETGHTAGVRVALVVSRGGRGLQSGHRSGSAEVEVAR